MGQATQQSRLAVLLFTDIEGSASLKQKAGPVAYGQALARHDAIFRDIICDTPGAAIVNDTGDGFLGSFTAVSDAINAALRFQSDLKRNGDRECQLRSRVGIHLGQVTEVEEAKGGQPKLVGLAADIAARVMSLASGSQILLTRAAFDDGRQFVRQHPPVADGAAQPPIKWVAHGQYLLDGIEEPLEIFEVGTEGIAPLTVPPSRGKAKRCVAHDEEPTLGWRPAVGAEIPGRPGWVLQRRLGEGGFGEVWLGAQRQLGQQRVFKFCFDVARLRSLKREMSLFRLIREKLGERPDIARLHEVKLDVPPFFLESEYTEGGNLREWAERQGGIAQIAFTTRLEIVHAVAEAVAAAHSVDVLHKDIKPSNILIDGRDGTPRPRLADFGIGTLADRRVLQNASFTVTGFTQATAEDSSRAGTPLYAPPESLEGRPFTKQGDVYALGVLLYQMVIANLDRSLAQGWERNVEDPLLREDIASCVDGDTKRRLGSAQELVDRLRALPDRRAEWAEHESSRRKKKEEEWERLRSAARLRSTVRIWLISLLLLVLLSGGATTVYFYVIRPDPVFANQWVQLVDAYPAWFRIFAEENLRNQLPAEYAATKEMVEQAQKQNNLELDPRDLSGKRELDEQRHNPPTTRDGIVKSKEALELARAVQMQMMQKIGAPAPDDLDGKALPKALVALVDAYAKAYEMRGWSDPAQQLAKLVEVPAEEGGGAYVNRLLKLFQVLPELKAIESNWTVASGRVKLVTDPDDPILKQFPAFVHRAVYADADRDNNITTTDIARRLRELNTEFNMDPFWLSFFTFVNNDWKTRVNRTAMRRTNALYARFQATPPPELTKLDLQEWLREAASFQN